VRQGERSVLVERGGGGKGGGEGAGAGDRGPGGHRAGGKKTDEVSRPLDW